MTINKNMMNIQGSSRCWFQSMLAVIVVLGGIVGQAIAKEPLVLGVHPYLESKEVQKRFSPLAKYLGDAIGRSIRVEVSSDYNAHIKTIGEGRYDIAYLGPLSYVMLTHSFGNQVILGRLEIIGKPTFQGKIIVRIDSPIRKVSDLKGKHFAFGNRSSTMSYLVPKHVLSEAGVELKDLGEMHFAGSHTKVAQTVLDGGADAGAVKEEVYYKNHTKGLKVLASTPPISEHIFTASKTMQPAMIDAIRNAFYSMHKTTEGETAMRSIKATMTGVVPAADSDYDNLRVMWTP